MFSPIQPSILPCARSTSPKLQLHCPTHDKSAKWCCLSCCVILCNKCTRNGDHKGHPEFPVHIRDAPYQMLRDARVKLDDIALLKPQLTTHIAATLNQQQLRHDAIQSAEKSMAQFFDSMVDALRDKQRQLQQELSRMSQQNMHGIADELTVQYLLESAAPLDSFSLNSGPDGLHNYAALGRVLQRLQQPQSSASESAAIDLVQFQSSLSLAQLNEQLNAAQYFAQIKSEPVHTNNAIAQHKIDAQIADLRLPLRFGKSGRQNGRFVHIQDVKFSGNGDSVLVCDYYNNRLQEHAISGAHLRTFDSVNDTTLWPTSLAIDQATNRVYVAHEERKSVLVFDATTGAFVHDIPVDQTIRRIAIDSTQGRVFTLDSNNKFSCIYTREAPHDGGLETILFPPNGDLWCGITVDGYRDRAIFCDCNQHQVHVHSLSSGQRLFSLEFPSITVSTTTSSPRSTTSYQAFISPYAAAVDTATGTIVVADLKDKRLTVWQHDGLYLGDIALPDRPRAVAIHPSGSLVAVGLADNTVLVLPFAYT